MINAGSLLANSYSSVFPIANTASAVCSINGNAVPCSNFNIPSSFFMFLGIFMVSFFILMILTMVSMWKVYQKAGKPGWASIIPIYNLIVMLEIVEKPEWWIILCFVPFVNIGVSVVIAHHLSKKFGQSIGFTLGLVFLPFVFYPMIAFGNFTYIKTVSNESANISNPPQAPIGTMA